MAEARRQLDQYFQAKSSTADQLPYELLAQAVRATSQDAKQAQGTLLAQLTELRRQDAANVPPRLLSGETAAGSRRVLGQRNPVQELIDRQPAAAAFQGLAQMYRRGRDADRLLRLLGRAVEQTAGLSLFGPSCGKSWPTAN